MINWENYEEYIIMHADGELQPADELELIAFLNAHPELKSELALYDATRISPDETLVYTDKNSLLRPAPLKLTVKFQYWKRYAIAAGIAALMFVSFFKYRDSNKNTGETAEVENVKKILPVAESHAPEKTTQVPQQMVAAIPISLDNTTPAHHKHIVEKVHYTKSVKKQRTAAVAVNNMLPANKEQINALALADIKNIQVNNIARPPLIPVSIPAYEPVVSRGGEKRRRSLIDRLPIDESNKHQLKKIAHLATGTYNGITKAKQQLDEYEITLNIEDKKFKISL